MKKMIVAVMAIPAALLLAGCSGSTGTPQGAAPEKVDKATDQTAADKSTPKQQQLFKINDEIKLGDYVVSVIGKEDPYKAKNQFMQPKAGNRLVAVEVVYQNNNKDKTLDYNQFDWKIFDSKGYNFESGMTDSKEPQLSSGTLNPSGKARGWVTFEVPDESKDFKIQFAPSFLSNENVEVQLY